MLIYSMDGNSFDDGKNNGRVVRDGLDLLKELKVVMDVYDTLNRILCIKLIRYKFSFLQKDHVFGLTDAAATYDYFIRTNPKC